MHNPDRLGRNIRQARAINHTILLVAAIITALLLGWWAPWAPGTAHAAAPVATWSTSPVRGEVDVCTTGLAKSWTRKLERKANREFRQRIDVHRRAEDNLGGCDVVIWRGGRVAIVNLTGEPSPNPRYHVQVGSPYNLATVEINVGTVTPRKQRPATIVHALREAGIR